MVANINTLGLHFFLMSSCPIRSIHLSQATILDLTFTTAYDSSVVKNNGIHLG